MSITATGAPAPVESVLHAIGRTPLLRLRRIVQDGAASRAVIAKQA